MTIHPVALVAFLISALAFTLAIYIVTGKGDD